ncbi:MAG: transcriptional regulator [Candidatus Heimdallarchaeota archaeon]|nr:transcriptional regulator [Candidatus Heimdallarchaeota archaeon]
MVNTLLIISPYLLIFMIVVTLVIIVYREYMRKITKYSIDPQEFQGKYLKILDSTDYEVTEDEKDLKVIETIEKVAENQLEVPSDLLNYSFLLNPIRLAIMKILYDSYKYPSADLRKILNISWGKYTPHLNQLEKKGYLVSEDEFIDNSPRKVLILEDAGRQQFESLESILRGLII